MGHLQSYVAAAVIASATPALAEPPEGCPPPRSGADDQLFARALEAGEQREAVKLYWELIKGHPTSRYAPVAWLQLGEHFFSARKWPQATKAFKKALETRKPLVSQVATIRLAALGVDVGDRAEAESGCRELLGEKNCWADTAMLDSWRKLCTPPKKPTAPGTSATRMVTHRISGSPLPAYEVTGPYDEAFRRAGFDGQVMVFGFGSAFGLIGKAWPDEVADLYEAQHAFAKRQGISPRTMEYSRAGKQLVKTIQGFQEELRTEAGLGSAYLLMGEVGQMPQAVLVTDGRCWPPLSGCDKGPPTGVRIYRMQFELQAKKIAKHAVRFERVVDITLDNGEPTKKWFADDER